MRQWPVLIALCLTGCNDAGEWKPTGDGKTIVHTKTGEIRYVASGLTVQEVAEQRRVEAEKQRAYDAEVDKRLKESNDERRRAAEAEEAARKSALQRQVANNSAVFHKMKAFVDKYPRFSTRLYNSDFWVTATTCFRTETMPTNDQVNLFLDILGQAAVSEEHKGNTDVTDTINELKKWQKYP